MAIFKNYNFSIIIGGDVGGVKSRFNTSSSKTSSSKLNLSCDSTAEFSLGQIAQPQVELDDFFPVSSSPIQNRRCGRGLVSIPISQRASFSANSTSPQKKGLIRKTSFRSQVSVVVQKPDQKPPSNESRSLATGAGGSSGSNSGKPATKAYESLKSQGSTGSTGSKTSTNSCSSDTLLDLQENVPNTEDADLLNQLSFVSPKVGVYRPVNNSNSASSSGKIKDKDKCILM